MSRIRPGAFALALFTLSLVGCAATATEMRRAEQAYADARYDAAHEWLVELEDDAPDMPPSMRARWNYYRGMTEYRLGHRLDALHYLLVTREIVGQRPHDLDGEQTDLLTRTLAELEPTDPMSYRPPELTTGSP